MGFWIFMLIMDLLIPFTMIGFGKMFLKKAPDQINYVFGYRTSMSMKNQDTWVFAHHYCGKIWYICGLILLVVSLIVLLLVIGKSNDAIGNVGGILCVFQMIPRVRSYRRRLHSGKILINMEIKDKSGGCHENSSIFPRHWLSL